MQIKAELVDYMGTDLSVCNAARVSFAKESEWEWDECGVKAFGNESYQRLSDKDTRLIQYLASHNHHTPFAHTAITLRCKAPIFVARQAYKSKIGFVENEVSRRYVSNKPDFYIPDEWREASTDKKQGSGDGHPHSDKWMDYYVETCIDAVETYKQMIIGGIAPEQARMILPQSMMTEWIWTGSLLAYARFYKLRTTPDAQKEIRDLAIQVGDIMKRLYPTSWEALTKEVN